MSTQTHDGLHAALEAWLAEYRARTARIIEPLERDDLHRQHDPIMSPLVWDLGHVANFEELWLLREAAGRAPRDERLDQVYNPFENPRWVRADLDILDADEAFEYLTEVRADALAVLRSADLAGDHPLLGGGFVYAMVAQHEAQHQETMLQALDLRGDLAPYPPARDRPVRPVPTVDDTERVMVPGGVCVIGTTVDHYAYDNERPEHRLGIDTFLIDRFPVTARRYAEFIASGGYEEPRWWSAGGQAWKGETGADRPQGWLPDADGGWQVRRFGRVRPLDPREILQHVSFWEAEAFCAWAGGRLPTEFEWEKAARWDPASGRARTYPWGDDAPTQDRANLDLRGWGPSLAGSHPAGASAYGVEHLVGDVHEWTSSPFHGYPGYASFPYKEYSEVFFGDEYVVLRGSSWASASLVARATFRNWDYPQRRQIFSGIRVAYDEGSA